MSDPEVRVHGADATSADGTPVPEGSVEVVLPETRLEDLTTERLTDILAGVAPEGSDDE